MINLCLDVSSLPYHRGVSRYTSNLVKALIKRPELALQVYGSSLRQYHQLKTATLELGLRSDQILLDRLPPSLLSLVWKLGLFLPGRTSKKPLVFHAWDWHLPPPSQQLALVVTIHDLAMLRFPQTAHPKILQHHQRVWQELKENNAQLVAVSRTTYDDIVELLNISPQRISVVPEALPGELKEARATLSDNQRRLLRDRMQLNQPFLLFVGTTEPRKNLARIIEAWQPLAKDYQLIIAGARGWDQLEGKLDSKLLHHPRLRFLGPVSDQQLSVLYSEASALIFASLYEGFGLPILEAFYHQTPVVTSDNSGMKEVAGNAAQLVDPYSVESIRAGIKTILHESVAEQEIRLKKMAIRSQMFSWDKAAEQMVQVYQQAEDELLR